MGFLTGKKLLITGVLSNRSIAYGIAKACHEQGAELAFSYVGERFKDRITDFAAEFDSKLVFDCDVASDEQIERMFAELSKTWPKFDGFVHSIGFAPREAIAGNFLDGLSRGVDRALQLRVRLRRLGDEHDARAVSGRTERDRKTDPTAATGDQQDAVRELLLSLFHSCLQLLCVVCPRSPLASPVNSICRSATLSNTVVWSMVTRSSAMQGSSIG